MNETPLDRGEVFKLVEAVSGRSSPTGSGTSWVRSVRLCRARLDGVRRRRPVDDRVVPGDQARPSDAVAVEDGQEVKKSGLLNRRNKYEDQVLLRLKEVLPEGTRVTVLADRGSGDQKLYEFLRELSFDFVTRFRAVVRVEDAHGEACTAGAWVPPTGRIKHLKNARVTASR